MAESTMYGVGGSTLMVISIFGIIPEDISMGYTTCQKRHGTLATTTTQNIRKAMLSRTSPGKTSCLFSDVSPIIRRVWKASFNREEIRLRPFGLGEVANG